MTHTESKVVEIDSKERVKPKPNYPRMLRDMFWIVAFSSLLVFGVNYLFFPHLWARSFNLAPTPTEIAPGENSHGAN